MPKLQSEAPEKTTAMLAKRVAALEKEVVELKLLVKQLTATSEDKPFEHDWEKTFGRFKDDPTYEEAVRLGREWRRRQNKKC